MAKRFIEPRNRGTSTGGVPMYRDLADEVGRGRVKDTQIARGQMRNHAKRFAENPLLIVFATAKIAAAKNKRPVTLPHLKCLEGA